MNINSWDNNWILIKDHFYLLKVFLFDREKNPITLTENLIFQNILDPEFFELIKINKINSEIIVRATKESGKQKIIYSSYLQEIKSELPYLTYPIE